jgi:hypothetical protein
MLVEGAEGLAVLRCAAVSCWVVPVSEAEDLVMSVEGTEGPVDSLVDRPSPDVLSSTLGRVFGGREGDGAWDLDMSVEGTEDLVMSVEGTEDPVDLLNSSVDRPSPDVLSSTLG